MNFTCSTKPLSDALNLGIINQNISKFYRKSCLAQVTATASKLTVNIEAAHISTQVSVKGSGDEQTTVRIFIDSSLFKQLMSTIETSSVTLEFADNGLIIHSGKSKFVLPKMIDDAEIELRCPDDDMNSAQEEIKLNKADWKFVKDHQMYAIAMSFVHPVYTNVWIGADGDVLIGDFDNSLFTHSVKSNLNTTCLLSDTIINLFNSLPEDCKLYKKDGGYIISADTDAFTYTSQFTPQYESDESVGSYNSDIILDMMKSNEYEGVEVPTNSISKFLSQADLLSTGTEDTVVFEVKDNQISIKDNNIDCKVDLSTMSPEFYSVNFRTTLLKSVLSSYSDESVTIAPMKQDGEVQGIILFSKNLTTVLAGTED